MREKLQKAFFSHGWLMPTLLPALTQIGGRGLFNTVAYSYVLWAGFALYGQRVCKERGFLTLYGLMLVAFLLGVPGAADSAGAFRGWLIFLLHSVVAVFTLIVLQKDPANLERLQRALGIGGLLTLLISYIVLGYLLHGGSFDPQQQLKEDALPFLFPFMLMTVWTGVRGRWRYLGVMVLSTVVFAYVLLSGGRAALLGLLVAVTVYGLLVLNWRPVWVGSTVLVLLALGLLLMPRPVHHLPIWSNALDAFTNGRTMLWRQALEHPPAHPLIGVGMGNVRFEEEILRIVPGLSVKHLHNFIMDAWYETGILGITALLGLIVYVLGRLAQAWRRLTLPQHHQAGLFLASALALLTAALLSFSYSSREFSIYLFLCFAALVHLTTRAGAEVDNPS